MVSLLKLAQVTEEGVKFQSPHDGSEMFVYSVVLRMMGPLLTDNHRKKGS